MQKAEKFIENYLGGFRVDLKPEIRTDNKIVFHQYIDGVKISSRIWRPGINIVFYENDIIHFDRLTFDIKKHEKISKNILSPIECIEKSLNFIKKYRGDSFIKFTEVNLAYFPRLHDVNKYTMIPAWEFTIQDHTEYLYLEAFTGEALSFLWGMYPIEEE